MVGSGLFAGRGFYADLWGGVGSGLFAGRGGFVWGFPAVFRFL